MLPIRPLTDHDINIKKEPPDIIEIMSMDEEAATPVKKSNDKPATLPKKATSVKKRFLTNLSCSHCLAKDTSHLLLRNL